MSVLLESVISTCHVLNIKKNFYVFSDGVPAAAVINRQDYIVENPDRFDLSALTQFLPIERIRKAKQKPAEWFDALFDKVGNGVDTTRRLT